MKDSCLGIPKQPRLLKKIKITNDEMNMIQSNEDHQVSLIKLNRLNFIRY